MMDDLPFCLEDLPPEIRNKIDDIIEKNEDLESQLDAIDVLLFANRPPAKSDVNSKFDLGNESGIGSDSDSGHGVVPAQDLPTISPLPSRPQDELLEHAKTFHPLLRTYGLNDDVDDFISQLIVPESTTSPARQSSPSRFAPRSTLYTGVRPSTIPASVSASPLTTRKSGLFEGDLPPPVFLPPPPFEFEGSPIEQTEERGSPRTDEAITAVRTGQNFHVTLDIPRGALSNGSPTGDSPRSNVTRVHVGKVEKSLPLNVTPVPVVRSVQRQNSAASESSAGRPSQLYAWNKTPELGSIREDPPDRSTAAKKSVTLPVKAERPSELNLSKDKQSRFWKKGKEKNVSSDLITTPTRYSQVATGPTVDLKRKKWRPSSDILPEGGRSVSLDSSRQDVNGHSEKRKSGAVDEERKGTASDDDLSGLVVMRPKNGKPAQNSRIEVKTLKAQSMLSLYNPSSDLDGRSKDKWKTSKPNGKAKTKSGPFSFFRGKNRKQYPDVRERSYSERTESLDTSTPRESEMEPLRSDYLFPVPPPLSFRSSIPSPSLYASVDLRNLQMRSPPPPGDVSEIYRIDVRDLDAGNRRPPATFDTFRGQIQPIRWSDERTRFPVSNRWSYKTFEGIDSPDTNSLRSPSALASRYSLPANLSSSGKSSGELASPSTPKESHEAHKTVISKERVGQRSSCALVLNGHSTPIIQVTPAKVVSPAPTKVVTQATTKVVTQAPTKVVTQATTKVVNPAPSKIVTPAPTKVVTPATTKVVTPAPRSTRVIAPAEPQVFVPSTAAVGTRLSIASACFSTPIPEECMDSGKASSGNGGVASVFLPLPPSQHLTRSQSNPRLSALKSVPGRLSPNLSFAGSADPQEEPHSRRISPCPSVTSVDISVSGSVRDDVDSVGWNGLEELIVLKTTYENETAGNRSEDDVRRMLSSLEDQHEWLLSASSTSHSSPLELFRSRKNSLATQSRRLVTEAKLMVSAATRSRHELTTTLTAVVHTVARVLDSCRLVLAVLPPGVRREMLLDQVLDVGRAFLSTLASANQAAGRSQDDPAMVQLMSRTTALAQSLYKLVNTTKALDNGA